MAPGRVEQAFELIRDEAVSRLRPGYDYPGRLCEICIEIDKLLLIEMREFREAEREAKNGV